jgi:hypothetical protein
VSVKIASVGIAGILLNLLETNPIVPELKMEWAEWSIKTSVNMLFHSSLNLLYYFLSNFPSSIPTSPLHKNDLCCSGVCENFSFVLQNQNISFMARPSVLKSKNWRHGPNHFYSERMGQYDVIKVKFSSTQHRWQYQKICFNCHQLTCRLIPSYHPLYFKVNPKQLFRHSHCAQCTVTVHWS